MVVRGFLEKLRKDDNIDEMDYLEVENFDSSSDGKVILKVRTLTDFADTEIIQQDIRQKNLLFIKIKPLKDKDITELKRAVDRLRKTCIAVNGDIAGVDEDFLVVTPDFVKIHKA